MISTHSRHVLDASRHVARVVWLSGGRIVLEDDLSTTELLLDLGALDSVDYFANGALRCVVATEDTDPQPLEALLVSNGFEMTSTEIASYAGCTNVESAIVLGKFIRARTRNVSLVVHRDADYLSADGIREFEARLHRETIAPFVTTKSDIDGYFVNARHVAHVNPGLTPERASKLIEQAIADTADKSVKSIIDHRTTEAFRVRRDGGRPVDHGAIGVAANADYLANPGAMCRGKDVARRLLTLIRLELREAQAQLFLPSPHLRYAELTVLAQTIWPPRPET